MKAENKTRRQAGERGRQARPDTKIGTRRGEAEIKKNFPDSNFSRAKSWAK